MFELNVVTCCPFGINGLLSDEAVALAPRVLVDPVHLALINSMWLVVVVRNSSVIGSTVGGRKTPEIKIRTDQMGY